jgi:hypothetical protein
VERDRSRGEGEICSHYSGIQREGKPLGVAASKLQEYYNKALDFWNLVDTYNPDVVMGTESWLREEISNAEVFRSDFTTFRRDRRGRGGGVSICVKIA